MRISDWSSDVCSSDLAADFAISVQVFTCLADGRFDVPDALVLVELAHQVQRLLELALDVGIKLHAGLQTPEEVGREREIAEVCHMVAFAADAFIDAEYLLDDDDRRDRKSKRLNSSH